MQMETVQRTDDIQHVKLIGSLDIAGTHEIDIAMHAATAAGGKPTIVDLTDVDFASSIGLGLLVACATSLQRKGARMAVFGVQDEVHMVMEASRLTQLIPNAEDEAAAVALVTA